jgi:phage protein U
VTAPAGAWASLGPHVFDAGASAETLKIAVALAEHSRLGRKPTQQLASLKLQELEWALALHSAKYDVAATVEALKASMEEGEVLDLVQGDLPDTGAWAGQWLITDMDIESVARAPGGAIYSADLKLRLKEWVRREGLEVSKRKAPAVKPKAPAAEKKHSEGPGYRAEAPK